MYRIAALALALAGCATESETANTLAVDANALRIEQSDTLAVGVYDDGSIAVQFRAEQVADSLDIELVFNEMVVTATVDFTTGVIEHDGFALADGSETQITDEDRAVIFALNRAIESLGTEVTEPVGQLRRFTSTWAEFPSTMDPKGRSLVQTDRSYYSYCPWYGNYMNASHDCWDYDWCEDASTLGTCGYYGVGALLSMHGEGPCADDTWFWTGTAWSCYEPNHSTTVEYAYGACFGRCGASCGSDTQFTEDCTDHDQCVRFGHDMASLWCDDHFADTIDDWASAPDCL